MAKRFLLVCEGPSDIPIFEAVAGQLGGSIIEISPIRDATSGSYPPHGWTEIRNWCLRLSKGSSVGNPIELFLRFRQAGGLIIQMDTDIAASISINGVSGVAGDKSWCHRGIDHWLGTRAGHANVHYILATHSTENWILATHSNSVIGLPKGSLRDYEALPDAQQRLISIGYKKTSTGALFKNRKQYEGDKYSKRVVNHASKVSIRCVEFDKLVKLFSA